MKDATAKLTTKVAPLIYTIDLAKDLTPMTQGAVNSPSVSGGFISNLVIKLLILKQQDLIDRDDYIELVQYKPEITAQLVKPDSMMSWMPLDEIELHRFSPVDNERFREALAKIRGE